MHILSIGKTFTYDALNIINISLHELSLHKELDRYDYIIISGGDGSIRRVMKQVYTLKKSPNIILNPTGSFNVIAKLHRVPKVEKILQTLAEKKTPSTKTQKLYRLNDEIFLFLQVTWVIFNISFCQKHYVLVFYNTICSNTFLLYSFYCLYI